MPIPDNSLTSPDNRPKITVITVCRNALSALRHTVDSVSHQSYAPLEYIIVDGASDDGTQEYLSSLTGIHWSSEPDGGIYDAMNKGVARATGTWCVMMNAGDTFAADDVLERALAQPGATDADVMYGDVVKKDIVKRAEPPHNAHRMYFCHQSALVRRECLCRFPFDLAHPMSADFKQMKQLFLAGRRFLQLPFPVACFDTSGISNTQRWRGLLDNIRVVREVDSSAEQLRLLPRLYLVYWWSRLRS